MRVAFCNRPTWNAPLGGDGVQMLKTKEYLEKAFGLEVVVVTDPEKLDTSFDLIHIFNYVTCEVTEAFFKKAIETDVPIVSSSIYWDYTYSYDPLTNLFIQTRLSMRTAFFLRCAIAFAVKLTGHPGYFSKKFRRQLTYFVDNSHLILPNSIEEGRLLEKFIRKDLGEKIHVVYNGAEISQSGTSMNQTDFLKKYGIPEGYILQVGRIEPIKNQINLVYALRKHPEIPIVFVGKVNNESYYNKLRKLAEKRGNVYFINAVPHEEITLFYRYARLHVLLSLRESPGLVSLEALYNDCPIVISTERYAPVETYFPDQPYVVDPLDCESIEKTVLRAYVERTLCNRLITKFSWETAAKQTYAAYLKVLNKK